MTKIKNKEQYQWALSRIETLINEVTEEMPDNDPRKMEYCILSNLVADYSDENFDLGTPSLQDCLKERMFEMNLSQKDVATILGTSQSRISELLSGKKNPTFEIAQSLCRNLNIPPSIVLAL